MIKKITDKIKQIDRKYLIGGAAVVVIILALGVALKHQLAPYIKPLLGMKVANTAKTPALYKITGSVTSIAPDKSSLVLKTDAANYTAMLGQIKTLKDSTGKKITAGDIKVGDKIDLRTRTDIKNGTTTNIDAYSIKDLSATAPITPATSTVPTTPAPTTPAK